MSFRPRLPMLPRLLVVLIATGLGAGGAQAQDDTCQALVLGSATIRCEIPLPEDTLLYLENQGVTRLLIDLNGYVFKLAADSAEVARSANAFPLPRQGAITIDIGAYMNAGPNVIEFTPQGPSGSSIPQLVIANVLLQGQEVAYAIEGLEPFPERLGLLQGYPNPFSTTTTLTYTIPEERITGVPVRLTIYDSIGRLVRVLVDGHHFPGTFTATWDGTAGNGAPTASGLYLAHLVAGEARQTVRLTRTR